MSKHEETPSPKSLSSLFKTEKSRGFFKFSKPYAGTPPEDLSRPATMLLDEIHNLIIKLCQTANGDVQGYARQNPVQFQKILAEFSKPYIELIERANKHDNEAIEALTRLENWKNPLRQQITEGTKLTHKQPMPHFDLIRLAESKQEALEMQNTSTPLNVK